MRTVSLLLFLGILFGHCSPKQESPDRTVDPGFSKFVSAYTSGVVGSQSNIRVELTSPIEHIDAGSVLPEGILTFRPAVQGQGIWINKQTIEFRPHEKLNSGQTYEAQLKLSELLDAEAPYQTMTFSFSVIQQNLSVKTDQLLTPDVSDLSQQALTATVRTNDHADPEAVKKCISASQDGRSLPINWTHESKANLHSFTISEISRQKAESFVKIEWNGQPIGAEGSGTQQIRIPPLGEFTLLQVNTRVLPGHHFSIQLSDPIKPDQDLAGLVYLRSGKRLRLEINGSEVKAFPLEKLDSRESIVIDRSIVNVQGHQLQESYEREVEINLANPSVELIGEGIIMPTSGDITFPFRAVNLKAVNLRILKIFEDNIPQFMQANQLDGYDILTRVGQLEYDGTIDLIANEPIDYGVWNNFSIDLADVIEPELGAIYRVMISYERNQSLYPCGDDQVKAPPMKRRKMNFADGRTYFNPNEWFEGYYNWNEKDDPCTESYYKYWNRAVSTNIIASNLGIIVKESRNNHYDLLVTDLRTGHPISDIRIDALNYQNQSVGEGKTDDRGMAAFRTKGKPYLLIAEKGDQKGYLRVDNGSALSVSLFDVEGTDIKQGLKGFLYGERGVWRPGDSIHLSFILEDKEHTLPDAHPLVLELYDPKGKLYDKRLLKNGVEGMYHAKLQTQPGDPTGSWQARVIVGNSTFHKSLKIEAIKPNRLRINFNPDPVVLARKTLSSELETKWLYGSPGANLKVRTSYHLTNLKTWFEEYEGFQFDDRSRQYHGMDPKEVEGTTNTSGQIQFSFPLNKPNNAPGMLKLKFNTKVFEPGGDYSQDFISTRYSPYDSYVGLKVSGGQNWRNALNSEDEETIFLAAVDAMGQPLSKKVHLKVYKLGWRWWWEGNGNDELTQYINAYDKTLLIEDEVRISGGRTTYGLKFDKPHWGRMLIVVEDTESGHRASQLVYAEYPGWWRHDGGGSEAASMLIIESDKPDYTVGEEVKLSVPSGGEGNIYVTVEKGDAIMDRFMIKAEKESTQFSINVKKEMAPNVYVTATLIQPHAQTSNSLPIRVYGVIPIHINDPHTHLNPVIKVADETRPERPLKIKVSEDNGRPMAYSLALVDEGLLSLTRYNTPDPWHSFYAKEALKVRTWDLYKYVMNAKTGKMISLLAVGGDEALDLEDERDVQRFKPIVKYLGPFYLKKGKSNTHEVHVPNYIGALRVMVVAGYQGAYGAAEKEVLVRQPLMVMSTLPRVVGPSERLRVPVSVISTSDKNQTVDVKVSTNHLLKPAGASRQRVQFEGAGEKIIYFEFDVAHELGAAEFRVDVNSDKNETHEALELKVRAPNPFISKVETVGIKPGKSWTRDYTSIGIKGSNTSSLSISRLPDMDLEKHLHYLINYPYGCIEQTTSSAFPQLFLAQLLDLSESQKEEIEENIKAALIRLRSFQLPDGGMGYWPGADSYISEWGTNYAGHFMIEAKDKGYDLPPGMMEQWLKFQRLAASNWQAGLGGDRYELTQAYRLFTMALAGSPDIGAMNRLKNKHQLSNVAAWRLSAAYAIVGIEDAARELANRGTEIPQYRETGHTYGSNVRDEAMILETMVYLKDMQRGEGLVRDIAKQLKDNWHGTQTRAYGLLAIAKFVGESNQPGTISFDLSINGRDFSRNTDVPIFQVEIPKDELASGKIDLMNRSEHLLFINFTRNGIPLEIDQSPAREELKMKVSYITGDDSPLDVSRLVQGQDFKAVVEIVHPGLRADYSEVALRQIFPSGWQITNTRVSEDAQDQTKFNYQDIKDDRVYTYFDLKKGQSIKFEVLLNATFCGKFYLPGIYCAPMYDESIQALDPGRWVEVMPSDNKATE